MKKNLSSLFFFSFIISNIFSQVTFQKTYGGSSPDIAYSVQQTFDNGFIVAGHTFSFGVGASDIFLVKTDANGDTIWTKTYGGTGNDYAYFIVQTADSGYIVAGSTNSFGAGGYDIYVLKLNAAGNITWNKTYGGFQDEQAYAIQQTSSGGYIIAGYTESFGAGNNDAYVIMTDAAGDPVWTKTYGGAYDDVANSIQQTTDNGFILCGYSQEVVAGQRYIYLVKTNSSGDTLWTKVFGGTDEDFGVSAQQTPDGGYIVASTTFSYGAGNSDACLIKTDSGGNIIWSKTYGGPSYEYMNSVSLTYGGGFLLNAYTTSFGPGSQSIYLVQTNSVGDTLWTKVVGGTSANEAYDARPTNDDGYIITGLTNSFGSSGYDFYLIKSDLDGNSGCFTDGSASTITSPAMQENNIETIINSPTLLISYPVSIAGSGGDVTSICISQNVQSPEFAHDLFTLFPNPAHDNFTISLNDQLSYENWQLSIYDVAGRLVKDQKTADSKLITINFQFNPGVYFVHLTNSKGETSVSKLVIN